MKATSEDVAKLGDRTANGTDLGASMKATSEDVAKLLKVGGKVERLAPQ